MFKGLGDMHRRDFFGEFYRKMDVRNGKSVYELPYQAKEITVRTILVKISILTNVREAEREDDRKLYCLWRCKCPHCSFLLVKVRQYRFYITA